MGPWGIALKHHQYLLNDGETRGVMLYDDSDECLGYAYIAEEHIGTLAVTHPTRVGAAFWTALSLAVDSGSTLVPAFIPGPCETALSSAVELGMRITIPMLLMSSRDFGRWNQYLPRNPGFM